MKGEEAMAYYVQIWDATVGQVLLAEIRNHWRDSRQCEHAEAMIHGEWHPIYRIQNAPVWEKELDLRERERQY